MVDVAQLGQSRIRRGYFILFICFLFGVAGFIAGIVFGPLNINSADLLSVLLKQIGIGSAETVSQVKIGVIENIRIPRAMLGFTVGAALGLAGATIQGFFRNPLADPGLVGFSAGAALAAVAVIVLGGSFLAPLMESLRSFALPMAAFFGALITVFVIYRVSSFEGRVVVTTMLLAGVAANALASAGIGYMTFLADDAQLRDLTFWTLGSLGGATWARVIPAIILMIIAIIGMLSLSRALNCMLLGEAEASALGVNVERAKRRAALCAALAVGAATVACGIVGFIGLVVPHLIRLIAGPDHRYVLPGSALLGGALVLFADLVARLAVAPAELPLGVVTAAIGAPFFFWLLMRDKRRVGMG